MWLSCSYPQNPFRPPGNFSTAFTFTLTRQLAIKCRKEFKLLHLKCRVQQKQLLKKVRPREAGKFKKKRSVVIMPENVSAWNGVILLLCFFFCWERLWGRIAVDQWGRGVRGNLELKPTAIISAINLMLMRSLDTFLPIENRGLMHTHVYKYTGHKVYMCTRIYGTRVYKCVCVCGFYVFDNHSKLFSIQFFVIASNILT